MVLSQYRGARTDTRPAELVRNVLASDRDADWRAYTSVCVEMERMDAGAFYGDHQSTADSGLWRGHRYLYDPRALMDIYVQRAMPALYSKHWDAVDAGAWGWPLVRRINSSIATAFSEWVEVRLVDRRDGSELRVKDGDGPGARDTEWAERVRRWPRIYADSDLPETTIYGERRRELHRGCFPWVRIVDGQILTDFLSPHYVQIEPHPIAPRLLDKARSITVPLTGATWGEYATDLLRVRYRHLDRPGDGEQSSAALWRAEIIDPDGAVVTDARAFGSDVVDPAWLRATMTPDGTNILGRHPVVGWYADPVTGPYPDPDWAGRRAQIGINLWLIQLGEAFYLGTLGIWTNKGRRPTAIDAKSGEPSFERRTLNYREVWSLPEGEDLTLVQARADIQPLIEAVEKRIKLEALARNLPPYVLDTGRQPSNVSGEARLAERIDLELVRARREKLLKRDMCRLLDVWQLHWNILHPAGDPMHLPPEVVGFKVLFRSLPPETIDQSAMQAIQAADQLGIAPRWDYPRMIEDLTVEEAMRRVRSNEAFAEGPTRTPTAAPDDTTGPEPAPERPPGA